jgi:hypothetical protein
MPEQIYEINVFYKKCTFFTLIWAAIIKAFAVQIEVICDFPGDRSKSQRPSIVWEVRQAGDRGCVLNTPETPPQNVRCSSFLIEKVP